jgi:hypothetical protein
MEALVSSPLPVDLCSLIMYHIETHEDDGKWRIYEQSNYLWGNHAASCA